MSKPDPANTAPCADGHVDIEVTCDESGIYRMHCKACGAVDYGTEKVARELGWIK